MIIGFFSSSHHLHNDIVALILMLSFSDNGIMYHLDSWFTYEGGSNDDNGGDVMFCDSGCFLILMIVMINVLYSCLMMSSDLPQGRRPHFFGPITEVALQLAEPRCCWITLQS